MVRHVIDRWYDTTVFGIALGLSGALVVPVLALGVLVTVIGGAGLIAEPSAVEFSHVIFALLTVGGTLGFVGYLRALRGVKDPCRHNVAATLAFLAAGILAALVVAGLALVTAIEFSRETWELGFVLVLGALFATANVVWAFAGIACMQRLSRRYAEKTGRAFDGLPAVLLLVAIVLAAAALLRTLTL